MRYACEVKSGEVHRGFRWGNLRERDHLKDPDIDGRIILNRYLRNVVGGHGLDPSGCCECGNEALVVIKCGEFPE
jgi:hypothetical protein